MFSTATAIMTFVRIQPPTKSHEFLFQKLYNLACDMGNPWQYIFISPSCDNKNNPLSLEYRYNFVKELYPGLNFIADPEIRNPFQAIVMLGKHCFEKVIIVCGEDRVEKYQTFRKYINHPDPEKTIPTVQEIEVISVGDRKQNSFNFLETISASACREAVKIGDFSKFVSMVPKCSKEKQENLYQEILKGLK